VPANEDNSQIVSKTEKIKAELSKMKAGGPKMTARL
jgi:hypothetical protein